MNDRIPLDHMNSDQLDDLYDQLARVRDLVDRWDNALAVDKPYARALRAALDEPGPLTDTEGRTVCTCTFATACGCGTSVHYQRPPSAVCAATSAGLPDTPLGPCQRTPDHPELFHRDSNGREWRTMRTTKETL